MTKNRKLRTLAGLGIAKPFLWFHKYAIVIILTITVGMSSIMATAWYAANYYYCIEGYGFGLILLAWLSIDGWYYDKCLWFQICLLGLANDCIVNMYYAPDYGGNYFIVFKILPTFAALLFALVSIAWNEYHLHTTPKNDRS